MNKEKKINEKNKKPFYKLWWFWLIIIAIFVGTWCLLFVCDFDARSSIIGILGIWGSTIATIFIGVIASKQNEHFTFISRKQALIADISENINNFQNEFVKAIDISQLTSLMQEQWELEKITDKNKQQARSVAMMSTKTRVVMTLFYFKNFLINSKLCAENIIILYDNIDKLMKYINDFYANPNHKKSITSLKQMKERLAFITDILSIISEQNKLLTYEGQQTKLRILSTKNLKEFEIVENNIIANQKKLTEYLITKVS